MLKNSLDQNALALLDSALSNGEYTIGINLDMEAMKLDEKITLLRKSM